MDHIDLKLHIFTFSVISVHIAYIAIFFGILYIDQRFIRIFSTFIQFVVCLFLIFRFWPLHKKHEITKLDVSIIFYCATFLLLNVVSIEIYNNIIPYIQNIKI